MPEPASDRPAVVIVHGLWMMPWAMGLLGARLAARGLQVHYFGYHSLRATLEEDILALARFCARLHGPRLHWVGHSLGAAIVLEALRRGALRGDGRVVLLAPPLREGLVVRRLSRFALGRAVLGRSLRQFYEDPPLAWSLPNELGILAGDRTIGMAMIVAPDLPSPNDGVIEVADTVLPGAREHRVLALGHTGLIVWPKAAELTANFLLTGAFHVPAAQGHA